MKRDYKISVALASYNGVHYIEEQINSILQNLIDIDELVISDDGSTDGTVDVIKKINDNRIRLLSGPKMGIKQNFANAIQNCSGKYIFLSDQDDIWMPNKVDKVLEKFELGNYLVVEHDCTLINSNYNVILESFFKYRKCGPGILKNIYKNTYIGCCMAFDSKLKEKILPIPNNIEMHDQWIGLLGDKNGKNLFLGDKLIKYRRHENNVSDCFHHYPLKKMLKNRFCLIKEFVKR